LIRKAENQAAKLKDETINSTSSLKNEVSAQTQAMKREAEDFVSKVFLGMEREISRTLTMVQKARQQVVGDYKGDNKL
jgi:hypothetical protein